MRNKMKNSKKLLAIVLTAIMVLSVVTVGIAPAGVTVTRDLPSLVQTNETFVVTLTQSGFDINTGWVFETLPAGFEYVNGSFTGKGTAEYNKSTRELKVPFRNETLVRYSVNASSYDQILPDPARFSGIYKAFVAGKFTKGDVGGKTSVIVDGTPPYTLGHDPARNATGVPIDTNITVHVRDNVSVDNATIVMTVKGAVVTPVKTVISLIEWQVTYNPPGNFSYGEEVNVTINASDLAGNAMTTDEYSFTTVGEGEKPDLVITDKWVCWPDNCTICYNITNTGSGTAPAGHNTTLYVDETEVAHDKVQVSLALGESYIGCFEDYDWAYTPPDDNITVCADYNETVAESDETNNCLTNIWMCGDPNENGVVDTTDVIAVWDYFTKGTPLKNKWAADTAPSSGVIDTSDVIAIWNNFVEGSPMN